MSNSGIFYLDYAGHSAKKMWFDMMAKNTNTTQRALLLGGEVSMWQDRYVGSCLFPNDQDANFSQSVSHCIWPRTAIAAGTFWGHFDKVSATVTDEWLAETFTVVQTRLGSRKVDTCPVSTASYYHILRRCSNFGFLDAICAAVNCG
eukprot:SAG11_NODE_1183_length_5593_cov_7.174190_5_plen_147_part_00